MTRRRPALLAAATVAAIAVLATAAPVAQQKQKAAGQVDRTTNPGPPTGLVVGRVVDATTNRPVAQATVTMIAAMPSGAGDPPPSGAPVPSTAPRVLTDADGRFLFRNLPAGVYSFAAEATAYLDGGYGQRRPGGTTQPFVLAEGARVGDLGIRLWKEATISGAVTDDTGGPVVDIWVSLLRRDPAGKPASLLVSRAGASAIARTDNRGAYRFAGLPPGDYVVSVPSRMMQWPPGAAGMPATSAAVPLGNLVLQTSSEGTYSGSNVLAAVLPFSMRPDGTATGFATTFHPGATVWSSAATIALKPGDDRAGIDVHLRPTPMVRLSGTIIGPGGPEPNFAVHLIPAFAANSLLERTHETAVTRTDAAGAFAFLAVPPGPFVLKAWRLPQILVIGRDPLPADSTLWIEQPIAVGDTALTNVTLPLRPGATISGRVRFEGATAVPNPQSLQTMLSVAFEPAWPLAFGARLATRATATGEFSTQGLPPGPYFANLPNNFSSSLRGWFFESATHEGKDLTISPLALDGQTVGDVVITFSDQRSQLAGTITDSNGRPDPAAVVLIFPADYRAWIQNGLSPLAARAEVASQTGAYAVAIRPGEYLVAAAGEDALAGWPRAATVEATAPTAARVTIARGDSKRLDLKRGSR